MEQLAAALLKAPEELGKVVDLAALVEEEGRPDQPEAPPGK